MEQSPHIMNLNRMIKSNTDSMAGREVSCVASDEHFSAFSPLMIHKIHIFNRSKAKQFPEDDVSDSLYRTESLPGPPNKGLIKTSEWKDAIEMARKSRNRDSAAGP